MLAFFLASLRQFRHFSLQGELGRQFVQTISCLCSCFGETKGCFVKTDHLPEELTRTKLTPPSEEDNFCHTEPTEEHFETLLIEPLETSAPMNEQELPYPVVGQE